MDIIIPWEKKSLSCYLGQLKFLPMDMIIPHGNKILKLFLGEQWTFPMERPTFSEETYVLNIFVIKIISYLFLYMLATYHSKGFEENYKFVVGSTLIRIHMQKLWSHKVFKHICSLGEHNLSCSLGELLHHAHGWPLGRNKPKLSWGNNHVPLRSKCVWNFMWS
jgi:hypothetical protein